MIYGQKKIGKTSLLASLTDKSFTLAFENVSNALRIMKRPIPTWDHLLTYVKLLLEEQNKYQMIVVDSLPKAYETALEYACIKYQMSHPGEMNDYGASWNKVSTEFKKPLSKLFALGGGVCFTAHETIVDVDKRDGGKFNIVMPEYNKACKDFVDKEVDNVFNYQYRGKERFLQVRGDDYVYANCAHNKNFLTPDGETIFAIPMGDNHEEAAQNLLDAFNNKQTQTFKDYREEVKVSKKPLKKKLRIK